MEWSLLVLAALLSLGWSIANGMRRRNPEYKRKIIDSATNLPAATRRRLLRLVAPTRLDDRANHALVIVGCCLVIYLPIALAAILIWRTEWWKPWPVGLVGSLVGALVGEFLFNSRGCAIELPAEPTPQSSDAADEALGQSPSGE